ncbi:MAG TPA: YciI family protein [Polyangiaceae bacterium]|nr:YciI family protein [Polyangiaceae bacterium]
MPKYLCLQRGVPGKEPAAAKPSPADMQAMYLKFNEWRERFQASVVDLGGRLGEGRLALHSTASDGPFIEIKELVGGYMILSAPSLDEALEIARLCPGLVSPGSGVEVIEIRTPG